MEHSRGAHSNSHSHPPSPSREGFFAKTYAEIRDQLPGVAEDSTEQYRSGELPLSERDVYAIWAEERIKTEGLRTTDGREIGILAPGWWNPGPGPDFSRAEILLEGQPACRGDVEIHLRSSDWEAHGHHTDKAYNRVILHVVLRQDRRARAPLRQDGESIPELALIDHLKSPLNELIRGETAEPSSSDAETGRCSPTLSSWPADKAGALFDLAGDERALLKARHLGKEAALHGYSQVTYGAVMEALGYAPNRLPFGDLARLLTEETLHHRVPSVSEHEGQTILEALYFGVGNLFPRQVPLPDSDDETDAYLTLLLDAWQEAGEGLDVPVMHSGEWNLKGLRPANHPRRRLAGMARLMMRHREKRIFGSLLEHLAEEHSEEDTATLADTVCQMLTVPPEGYWGDRHNFGPRTLGRPLSLIGKERVGIMLVNAAIPALLAYSRSEGRAGVEANLQLLYSSLPPSPPNRTLRFMAARLFSGKTFPPQLKLNARRQQGLIQVYHDFCGVHEGGCGDCLFPDLLRHL